MLEGGSEASGGSSSAFGEEGVRPDSPTQLQGAHGRAPVTKRHASSEIDVFENELGEMECNESQLEHYLALRTVSGFSRALAAQSRRSRPAAGAPASSCGVLNEITTPQRR